MGETKGKERKWKKNLGYMEDRLGKIKSGGKTDWGILRHGERQIVKDKDTGKDRLWNIKTWGKTDGER